MIKIIERIINKLKDRDLTLEEKLAKRFSKDSFHLTTTVRGEPLVKIEIKSMTKCEFKQIDERIYKIIDTDMVIDSTDIKLTKEMKKVILDNLYYYPEIMEFGCRVGLYDLYLLAGDNEQRLKVIAEIISEYDGDRLLRPIKIIKVDKDGRMVNIVFDCKINNSIDRPIELEWRIVGNLLPAYFIRVSGKYYSIEEMYRAVLHCV